MEKKLVAAIDDDPNILELLEAFLEGMEYDVKTWTDGREFFSFLKKKQPDIIIVDLVMPEYSGLHILSQVREIYQKTPVVIVSGQNLAENEQVALLSNYFLTKPVSQVQLLNVLKECCPDEKAS